MGKRGVRDRVLECAPQGRAVSVAGRSYFRKKGSAKAIPAPAQVELRRGGGRGAAEPVVLVKLTVGWGDRRKQAIKNKNFYTKKEVLELEEEREKKSSSADEGEKREKSVNTSGPLEGIPLHHLLTTTT